MTASASARKENHLLEMDILSVETAIRAKKIAIEIQEMEILRLVATSKV